MKRCLWRACHAICLSLIFMLLAAACVGAQKGGEAPKASKPEKSVVRREVAVTFDDLPGVHAVELFGQGARERNERLVGKIKANGVPAVGLVTTHHLTRGGKTDELLVSVLRMWLDAGIELGNHTYSHPNINAMPLAAYEADVVRAEPILRRLLQERGMRLRYFRHPQLYTGPTLETKRALDKFLAERGYEIAPVTVDNNDFIFSGAYAEAKRRGDSAAMKRLVEAYIPYMETMFDFFEKLSVEVVGYEIKQVLLLHDNEINADTFDQLVEMMRRRGYRFITLEEALKDKAYRLPDDYAGRSGLSWLHRWAITKGMAQRAEPREPAWVREMFEAGQRAALDGDNSQTARR